MNYEEGAEELRQNTSHNQRGFWKLKQDAIRAEEHKKWDDRQKEENQQPA